jgi:hypothetical protein
MEVVDINELHISDPILLGAAEFIEKKFPGMTTGRVLAEALQQRIGLSEAYAGEMGARIDTVISAARGTQGIIPLDDARFSAAISELLILVRLDFAHDLDYLAGYSESGPGVIYIDRGVERERTLSGKKIDVVRYLTVHEVVEKTIIDAAGFDAQAYRRAHQIASRIERAALEAEHVSFKEYDDLMWKEVARVSAVSPNLKNVPPDLDLSPHIDMNDPEYPVIKELRTTPRSLRIPDGADIGGLFTTHKIGPQIYHLQFHDPARSAATMMRFSEFAESPKFKGVYFTRQEFEDWYQQKTGKSFVEAWAGEGFNIPSMTLEPFYDGHFWPLTDDEMTLLDYFSDQRGARFYIIATAEGSAHDHRSHEIAHALYYVNADYKKEVEEVLAAVDTTPVRELLATHPDYGYHEAVLNDEVHAYLSHTGYELAERGLDLAPYQEAITRLQEIYTKYAPA